MSRLSRHARALLDMSGVDPALIGDLEESAHDGRSGAWCWYQALGAVFISSWRSTLAHPIYAIRGIALGWAALLTTFAAIDTPAIDRLRLAGYQTDEWATYWVVVGLLSYTGFAVSAWTVARFHRKTPTLVAWHTGSVVIALLASAIVTTARSGPFGVPHALFPLVSVTLPYQWRSGLVLVPTVMLLTGFLVLRRASAGDARRQTGG